MHNILTSKEDLLMEEAKLIKLRRFNFIMGTFHLAQGIMMLVLALSWSNIKNYTPAIYSNYLIYNPVLGRLVTDNQVVFNLPFGILVAVFLLTSGFFHYLISLSKKANNYYNYSLEHHINPFRWYEYALSSSLMIVLIAVLFGVYDIGTLIAVFFLNVSMNLFGLLMEKMNQGREKTTWLPFIFGSVAGLVPWIIILMYGFGNADPSQVPWFVYAIAGVYFVFFNCFPVNMVLQYKKIGKWKDYLYGERGYIILSLVAKTLLAWLVLFGVMQPQ